MGSFVQEIILIFISISKGKNWLPAFLSGVFVFKSVGWCVELHTGFVCISP